MTRINNGDRVRVTLEGTYRGESTDSPCLNGHTMPLRSRENVTLEKIEPPVEVFQRGDVVRHRQTGNTYTLTNDGYVSHTTGAVWMDGAGWRDSQFTSERYERVELP